MKKIFVIFCLLKAIFCAPENYCLKDVFTEIEAVVNEELTVLKSSRDFKEASYIGIDSSNVTILCKGSFSGLENLVTIRLHENNMEAIEPGAFVDVPKIFQLYIGHNSLTTIKRGVFNGLSVSQLILLKNGIETIEKGAFDDMNQLSELILSRNYLTELDPNWFYNKQINHFDVTHNALTTLPKAAFEHISSVPPNIWLAFNKLQKLHPNTFEGIKKIHRLLLDNNRIDSLPDEIFEGVELNILDLENNNFECFSDGFLRRLKVRQLKLRGNPLDCGKCLPKLSWANENRTLKTDCMSVKMD